MAPPPTRAAATAVALACLLVAASGGAAGHAAALFDDRDLAVDAGDSVDVGLVFHNVDSAEFRLEGPDGFRLTGSVRNTGDASATLTLDTGAAGRGDARAALRVSGGEMTGANIVTTGADGALPAGEYDTTLVTQGITVDRGSLIVNAAPTATPAAGTTDGAGTATVGTTTPTPVTAAETSTPTATTTTGAGFGPLIAVAGIAPLAIGARAIARR